MLQPLDEPCILRPGAIHGRTSLLPALVPGLHGKPGNAVHANAGL